MNTRVWRLYHLHAHKPLSINPTISWARGAIATCFRPSHKHSSASSLATSAAESKHRVKRCPKLVFSGTRLNQKGLFAVDHPTTTTTSTTPPPTGEAEKDTRAHRQDGGHSSRPRRLLSRHHLAHHRSLPTRLLFNSFHFQIRQADR